MDEDLKLYIPLGVKPEAELFTGFGKKQLFQALVGSLAMGGVAALVWLFESKLSNEAFVSRAPEKVVNDQKEKLAKNQALLAQLIESEKRLKK